MSGRYLPASAPRYQYRSEEQCLSIIEQELDYEEEARNIYLILFAVDESSFLKVTSSPNSILNGYWKAYDPTSQTLLFRIESPTHACAASTLGSLIHSWGRRQQHMLLSTSAATHRGAVGSQPPAKKGDFTFRPEQVPATRGTKWPTIAGEVAYTETRHQLEHDMQWWHTQGNDNVRVVLSIIVHRRGRITIEKWDRPAPGADPVPTQKMDIVRNPAPNCPRISGSLTISYEDIYLHPKQANETDLVFTNADMEQYAREVWAIQFPS
jgi:hypothetical protein